MIHANVAVFIPHVGCPHQCSFCNQRSITGKKQAPLVKEVAQTAYEGAVQAVRQGRMNETEFAFFGGSFTAIPRDYMVALLEAVYPFVKNGSYRGIRISTRPDAIDEEVLLILKSYGVTSIELGAQSMLDEVLRKNNRGHTAKQVAEASRKISSFGFSLGLQMMTGLYGDTPEGSRETAMRLADLNPDTIRIYPTIVVENTELAVRWRTGEYQPMTLEDAVELCADLLEFFDQRNILVIRLGLHASQELERERLTGPWHPAFRELCESRRMRRKMEKSLCEAKQKLGRVLFQVHPRSRSKAVGQKKENLIYFQSLGYELVFQDNEQVPENQIELLSML